MAQEMKQETIYLCYETDGYLTYKSRDLVYIGTDLEDCIAKLEAIHFEFDEKNKEDLRKIHKTIFSDYFGIDIDEEKTNSYETLYSKFHKVPN